MTPYERLAFLEMAGHGRTGDVTAAAAPQMLEKWTHDVHVAVDGAPTPADLAQVDGSAAALSLLMAPRRVIVGGGRDIVVTFVPKAGFADVVGADYPDYADGVTRPTVGTGRDAGRLRSAVVVVDTALPQYGRNHVIAHELLHAIGLNHSTCASSVMFARSRTDTTPQWSLPPFDQRMVRLLYRPELPAGITPSRAARVLTPTATTGVECAPVPWQVVIDAGTRRPYFCVASTERYRPCTADVSVEPPAAIARPDLWFDGTFVYARRPGG